MNWSKTWTNTDDNYFYFPFLQTMQAVGRVKQTSYPSIHFLAKLSSSLSKITQDWLLVYHTFIHTSNSRFGEKPEHGGGNPRRQRKINANYSQKSPSWPCRLQLRGESANHWAAMSYFQTGFLGKKKKNSSTFIQHWLILGACGSSKLKTQNNIALKSHYGHNKWPFSHYTFNPLLI